MTIGTLKKKYIFEIDFLGEATHCWRRYDGFNVIPTLEPNKFKKPYGILCNYQCNFFIIKR